MKQQESLELLVTSGKQRSALVAFVPGKSSDFPLNLQRPDGDGHLRRLRKDFLDLQRSHLPEIAHEEPFKLNWRERNISIEFIFLACAFFYRCATREPGSFP